MVGKTQLTLYLMSPITNEVRREPPRGLDILFFSCLHSLSLCIVTEVNETAGYSTVRSRHISSFSPKWVPN